MAINTKDIAWDDDQPDIVWNDGPQHPVSTSYTAPKDMQKYAQDVQAGVPIGTSNAIPPMDETKAIAPQPRLELSPEDEQNVVSSTQEGYRILGASAQNVPESFARFTGDIYQTLAHPIRTAKSMKDLSVSVGQLLIPGEQGKEQISREVGKYFIKRYGGVKNVLNTFENDPVGFASDLSTILQGGGFLVAKTAGKVGVIGKNIETFAKTVEKVGRGADPISVVTSGVMKAGAEARPIVTELLGVTTGAGAESIEQAIRGSEQFRTAMRGNISGDEIVASSRRGMQVLKQQRAQKYMGELEKISEIKTSVDITPLISGLNENLKKFNVKRLPNGGFDFKDSVIRLDKAAQKEITQIAHEIDTLGMRKGSRTPASLDILKRVFSDRFSESSSVRAFTTDMTNRTRQVLIDNVQGYENMVKDYEKASRLMNEMDITLSLKKGRTPEQTLNKLTQGLKEDAQFKKDFIRLLSEASGEDIMAKIAGLNLNKPMPSGGLSRLLGAGELAFFYRLDPSLLPILLTNSPRAVGEFFNAITTPIKVTKAVGKTGIPSPVSQLERIRREKLKETK